MLLLGSAAVLLASGQLTSQVNAEPSHIGDPYLLHDDCLNALNDQISWELYASIVYMNMGGYFDRPSVARKGFAKFFKSQSKEEYSHASEFIDYINKRNGTVKRISVDESPKSDWISPKEAISDAIKLEKHVHARILHVHNVADLKCQDAHLTDFLESAFLTEQVNSISELQAMLTTLESNEGNNGQVIEYLEDKRLASKVEL